MYAGSLGALGYIELGAVAGEVPKRMGILRVTTCRDQRGGLQRTLERLTVL